MPALDPPLAGLVARYRGDSLVDDGGGFASAWNDLSGNGYHLAQATAANRPAIVADILNGQPGARFDGANDQLFRSTTPTVSQPITFVAISKLTLSNSTHKGIVSTQSGTQCRLQYDVSEAGSIYAGSTVITDAGSDLNMWRWHIGEINGASSKLYEDGVLVASGNPGTGTVAGIKVGAHATDTQFFGGDIAEVIVYDRALTHAERVQLARYANQRYGIAFPFPQVLSVTETAFTNAISPPTDVALPSEVEAGELLLLLVAVKQTSGTPGILTPGWTILHATSTGTRRIVAAKVADGSEGGGFVDIDANFGDNGSAQVYRIANWYGSLAGIEMGTPATGVSSTPNPPSLTASWGIKNNLWLAVASLSDDDGTVNAYPANYTAGVDTVSGGGANSSASLGSARRALAAASEDPGAFTLSESEDCVADTLVIRPIALPSGSAGILAAAL